MHIKINYTVLTVQYTLIEHPECIEIHDRIKQTYACIVSTLIEHSSNKTFTSMLYILKHNRNIVGSLKSIIDKNFGNIPKAFWAFLEHI